MDPNLIQNTQGAIDQLAQARRYLTACLEGLSVPKNVESAEKTLYLVQAIAAGLSAIAQTEPRVQAALEYYRR